MLSARGGSTLSRLMTSLLSLDNSVGAGLRGAGTSLPRLYSSDDGKPAEGEAAAAPEAAAPSEPAAAPAAPAPQGPTQADLMARGLTKRQAAWLAPDPDKQKHFLPRLSRKERGSYAHDLTASNFLSNEVDTWPRAPEVPLYNLREVVPEMVQPRSDKFDALRAFKDANPGASIEEMAAAAGVTLPPPEAPPPGLAEPILQWSARLTLSPAVAGEEHPANKKAKCRVHLRALQRQTGMSEAALQRIAAIAGPRYDQRSGVLTLTSDKFLERELNREHILGMLRALVAEGRRVDAASATAAA